MQGSSSEMLNTICTFFLLFSFQFRTQRVMDRRFIVHIFLCKCELTLFSKLLIKSWETLNFTCKHGYFISSTLETWLDVTCRQ